MDDFFEDPDQADFLAWSADFGDVDFSDPDLQAFLAATDEVPPVEEPAWSQHPVYAPMVSPDERVRELLSMPVAVRPVGELARIDPRTLGPGARVDLLTMLDQQEQHLQSRQQHLLAELDRTDATKLGLSGELVSLVLRIPRRAAQHKLKVARSLVDHLPATLGLLADGRFTVQHAQVITEASWGLDRDVVSDFEAAVTDNAGDLTVRSLRDRVRKEANRIDPVTAEQKHRTALADRSVGFCPGENGMAHLPVTLPAPDAQAVFTRLTAAARLLPTDDPRTMDQKRADLLVDAVLSGIPFGALPELQGRRPTIHVTVSADTLLGLNDEPGHLSGYGPVTADTARRLAADQSGTWRRLLTDPNTGDLLDISADTYRPSQRLRDFIAARDEQCAFPGCHQPAYRCEYEHTLSFGTGGKTCRANGAAACKRHNLCKIDTGWGYIRNDNGSFSWTTDTGHTFTSHPPRRWTHPDDPPPPVRKQPTPEDAHAQEDTEYQALIKHWNTELAIADTHHDQPRAENARNAITHAEHQRARQLAHRTDPNHPPF